MALKVNPFNSYWANSKRVKENMSVTENIFRVNLYEENLFNLSSRKLPQLSGLQISHQHPTSTQSQSKSLFAAISTPTQQATPHPLHTPQIHSRLTAHQNRQLSLFSSKFYTFIPLSLLSLYCGVGIDGFP